MVSLTGSVNFGSIGVRLPDGVWSLIGEDGKHYIVNGNHPSDSLEVGCAETNTVIGTISDATWQADVGLLPSASGVYRSRTVVPAKGTQYVLIIGSGTVGDANENDVAGIFYKVDAAGDLVKSHGFLYSAEASGNYNLSQSGNAGHCAGSIVIGDRLYFTITCRDTEPVGIDQIRFVLAHVPLTVEDIDLSPGTWTALCTNLPFGNGFAGAMIGGGRRYGNFTTLMDVGEGVVRVLSYVGQDEYDNGGGVPVIAALGGPGVLGTQVDTVAHDNIGSVDLSALFGVPFSDTMLKFDETASSNIGDDYTSPSLVSSTRLVFGRPFSDNIDTVRLREFRMTGMSTVVALTVGDHTGFTITSVAGRLETVFVYREGSTDHLALRDHDEYYFYSIPFSDSDCPPCEVDTEPCGETVEPPCNATWPFDELQPRSVGIHLVPATIGGGPAMAGGNEQVAATANGFWRFTYGEIRVHDRDQILKWRAMEVLLEGRAGVICLHAYDGKRAPWLTVGGAIVASASGAFAAGATSGSIKVTTGGVLLPGMFFSWEDTSSGGIAGPRLYCLKTVGAPSGSPPVYPVTIFPPIRAAIAADELLEFARPMCRARLADDRSMSLPLHLLEHASQTVEFEEDI